MDMSETILVTGATGNVGSEVVKAAIEPETSALEQEVVQGKM